MSARHRLDEQVTAGVLDDPYAGAPAEPAAATYRVLFDRIGRDHDIAPLIARAATADELAEVIYRYARPHLRSTHVDVSVDLDQMRGAVVVGGVRPGGDFTIEHEQLPAPAVTS